MDFARTHVMLDLETLGNGPTAAIASIGAVRFDTDGQILSTFERTVRLDSKNLGTLDPETVGWWLQQSDAARAGIGAKYAVSLEEALTQFSNWLNQNLASTIWACDPSFDCVILRSAYERFGWKFPIDKFYRKERSFRTAKMIGDMLGVQEEPKSGTLHNALDDATNQALYVAKVLRVVETAIPNPAVKA